MGTAVGDIGMTVDDFCRSTPAEFAAVAKARNAAEQRRERAAWERVRLQCTCALQPYSKRRLDPQDVLRFAWDGGNDGNDGPPPSAKEIRERFEKVKEKMGLQ